MTDVVISAEGLGKAYLIGQSKQAGERYTTFRDVIAGSARNLVRSTRDILSGRQPVVGGNTEEFWALDGVSFEIKRGEVTGIVGRNGAGKSTLLKILSRITEPSRGRVTLKGRVASLLEVGTGFHPELTGRENIFLNGAILGMTSGEIRGRFDEIVAFAEVERFLDTPVKRYSSGMYVRLAFAVAAHLEPEILIVDEVLAVGDADFQKKCLGKMQDVAGQGRTVLFVSHNISSVLQLCNMGIVLDRGKVLFHGLSSEALAKYASLSEKSVSAVELSSTSEEVVGGHVSIEAKDVVSVTIEVNLARDTRCAIECKFKDIYQAIVAVCETGASKESEMLNLRSGRSRIKLTMSSDFFFAGRYELSVALTIPFHKGYAHTIQPMMIEIDGLMAEERRRISSSPGWGSIRIPAAVVQSEA